jgi:arabinose-5-phosphate isomerase
VSGTTRRGATDIARDVLRSEARAVEELVDRLDDTFEKAVEMLYACPGRVVVTGMGKSGIIGKKIAATLSSTGTPALFLHPAEAVHGDLGMVVEGDVVLALSNSGETPEIIRLLETIRRIGAQLVTLTGGDSTLSGHADVNICVGIPSEACPLDLAPTASTTAQLAMGDALAMSVMHRRGFTAEEFAARHPGGDLGRKLVRVERLMHTGDAIPKVSPSATLGEIVEMISSKGLGTTVVVHDDGRLAGVITDGDLRRLLQSVERPLESRAKDFMSRTPASISGSELAVVALRMMEDRRITSMPVVDDDGLLEGFLHLHDLWRTQMF